MLFHYFHIECLCILSFVWHFMGFTLNWVWMWGDRYWQKIKLLRIRKAKHLSPFRLCSFHSWYKYQRFLQCLYASVNNKLFPQFTIDCILSRNVPREFLDIIHHWWILSTSYYEFWFSILLVQGFFSGKNELGGQLGRNQLEGQQRGGGNYSF